jgi:hypothetical protein
VKTDAVIHLGLILLLGVGLLAFALVVGHLVRKRVLQKLSQPMDFREFSPRELDRLKGLGLISDEEVKRLQSVIAQKSMEMIQKATEPPSEKPDLQSLLAEAERLHKQHLASRPPPKEQG